MKKLLNNKLCGSHGLSRSYGLHKLCSGLLLMVALSSSSAYAAQKHLFDEEAVIRVDLSKSRINRIGAKEDKISKVIGNTSEFQHETDNGNIFIVPTGNVGSHFEVTLNMESGKTQALRCKVNSTDEGQIILLSSIGSNSFSDASNNASSIYSTYASTMAGAAIKAAEKEALDAIKAMAIIADLKFKAFDKVALARPLKLLIGQQIDFKNIKGFKLLIKNTSRKPFELKERDIIINGYKVVAANFESSFIGPYQQTIALVAAERR